MKTLTQCTKTIYNNFIRNNPNLRKVVLEDIGRGFYSEEHYIEDVLVARMTSQECYDETQSYGWRNSCWIKIKVDKV